MEGGGDFSRQKLECKLCLAGLFWAEPQRRIKQRATNPSPSLPLQSLPSPRFQSGRGWEAHSFPALRSLKRSRGATAHNPAPAAENFAAKGSPIRSGEVKSAPKGNFNCLTRPDFLRGGSAGRGGKREAAPRGNRGQAAAEKGDQSGKISAPAPEKLLQKGLRGYHHRSPGDV